ncbi:MAG: hypothetical protein KAW12_11600 [Candidatus Aminicenantes bacterium]|nr:hypothetical protein [Candidatus Aminicenantes bacterium]
MSKETSKNVRVFLFWGSLWGLAEATLGSLFHLIPFAAGFFMFPIGFYFMKKSLDHSGKLAAIFYTASIAAGIKLTGLLLPLQTPGMVIKPAVAIMLEAAAVVIFFKLFNYEKSRVQLRQVFAFTAGWRVLFIAFHGVLLALSPANDFLQAGLLTIANFLVLESMINTFIIYFFLKLETGKEPVFTRFMKPGYVTSSFLLAAAVCAELIL